MSNIDRSMLSTAAERQAARLVEKRLATSITKSAFCIALAEAGHITDEECVSAAKGEWPDGFAGFLSYLPSKYSRNARTLWAATTDVLRMDATILAMAWWFNIPDETLDRIFGLTA